MTQTPTEELSLLREVRNAQDHLRDLMARFTHIGSKEEEALLNARQWLGNISQPLTESELDAWNTIGDDYCASLLEDHKLQDIEQGMTDEERRDAIQYMHEIGGL